MLKSASLTFHVISESSSQQMRPLSSSSQSLSQPLTFSLANPLSTPLPYQTFYHNHRLNNPLTFTSSQAIIPLNIYGFEFVDYGFVMKSGVSDFTQDKQCQCWYADGGGEYDEYDKNYYEKSIRKLTMNFLFQIMRSLRLLKKQIPIQ
ncbi:hypothetical protein Glove_87g100 [Diversispora epigaea]|uniref:Uncharacterized protein n=1 Tax=Diversispora epigaea TaxID=1348612 RepID=A0A397JF91_9GLOM|nr:hypothetical protein Glove_87g100 [Diversispora epigaea]